MVIAACVAEQIAIVPFGGGTSVVGGVEPLRGRFSAVIALDLERMDAILDIDTESLTATMQPGLRAPAGRGAAARAGPVPRPLPAELRVHLDRRDGGLTVRGSGLDRATVASTTWCCGCASRPRPGR